VNRKLILLNVALVLVAGYGGYRLRNEMQAAKARETAMKNAKVRATPPPPLAPLAEQPPVLATNYKDVAMKTLFSPTRNPDLPPPPVVAPPPPKPMPALPKYHGTMNIGDGPIALLSMGEGQPGQEVRTGGRIGAFTLVDFNTVDMTFDWDGTTVRRTLDQLTDRNIVTSSGGGGDAGGRSVSTPPPAAAMPVVKTPTGPGESTAFGFKTCDPNDSLPDGTVQGGFRKTSYSTPFGKACRWDPVGR